MLDVKLRDANGLELLPLIKKRWADTEVIMLTGEGTMAMAMEAGRLGAYTFLSKPFETEKLLADVKCAFDRKQQNQENTALRRALETMSGNTSPVFRSPEMLIGRTNGRSRTRPIRKHLNAAMFVIHQCGLGKARAIHLARWVREANVRDLK